jgi:hypothetical protein
MKRLVGSLAAGILVLGCFAASASATHSNGQGPDKDFINGSAKALVDIPPQLGGGTRESHQHINAQADAAGAGNADGYFFLTIFGFPIAGLDATVSGDVLCLDVVLNQSIDRSVIVNSDPPGFEGFGLLGKHIDNGEPGHGPPPDLVGGTLTGPPGPAPACPPGNTPFPTQPVDQGNFVIHDGI